VAEVNQGGDLVQGVIRQIDPLAPFRAVRAMRSKMLRAEPVAALYEQGRVAHLRGLEALEAQMLQMARTGWKGQGSPDRLDALVWALTDLVVDQAGRVARPGLRTL
jgi:phage terminase large subunit-like protein